MPLFSSYLHHLSSLRNVLIISIVIRVTLILYSEWHDAHSVVKYTDVDYRVFSDATRFLLNPGPGHENHPRGPLGELFGFFGDPYTRETYRYTPLLGLLLAPNEFLHPSFGKFLFAACDIVNALIIYELASSKFLPTVTKRTTTHYAALHALNPMVFSISTRGSSESVLCCLILLTLRAALNEQWRTAAVLLGVSTHWKIYPFIYGVACLQALSGGVVNVKTIKFALLSAGTFLILGVVCYSIWGYPFLHESYLYHLYRSDHRHNFSPYFYQIYLFLSTSSPPAPVVPWIRSPLMSFTPQLLLSVGLGLCFGTSKENLPFTWFVQTFAFVVFNKVCTSQYFLWYLLFLPLIIARLHMTRLRAALYTGVWAITQALWLAEGYKLEFLGQNVFKDLWVRGLVYVAGNAWVLGGIVQSYNTK